MFWGKLSCFQIRNKANREAGGCESLGGFRAGEVSGVAARDTRRASERQGQLCGMFEGRSELRGGGSPRRSLNATEALVVQLCTHGGLQNSEEELRALETPV